MKMSTIVIGLMTVALSFIITAQTTTPSRIDSQRVLAYSSSCPSACDKNGDGSFTVDDAQAFASCIFTGCAADVNGDGTINAGDVSYCTANCQDIMITPTPVPTTVPSPTLSPTSSPTVYSQPTSVPATSTQNTTNTYVYPTTVRVSPTPIYTQNNTQTTYSTGTTRLRKDSYNANRSGSCDVNLDGTINASDINVINKCIFDGYGYCAATDINFDGKVDAGDISAAVLCSSNGQAMPNCRGADTNNDGRITQTEAGEIANCIFSGCALIDPNNDGKTDAGDISACALLVQAPTQKPTFSCSLCTEMNYCDSNSVISLQNCIFNPNLSTCQAKRADGSSVWDINRDGKLDAGDISSYSLCRSCRGACNAGEQNTNNLRSFFTNLWNAFGRIFR